MGMENKISMERFLISCISEVESMLQDADFEVSRKKYNDDTLGILVNKGYAGEIPIYYSSLMKCVIAKYRSRPYNDLPEFDDYEKMILLKEFSDKKFIRDLISYIAQKRIEGDFKEQNKREVVGSAAVEEDTISTTQVVNVPDAEVGTNIESNVCNPVFGEEKQEGSKENKYLSSDEAPNTNENKVKGRKPKKETKQQKRERLQKARLQLLKEKKAEKKASVVKKETSSSSIACVRSADADRRVQEREEVLKKVKARNEKVKGEMRVTDEDIDDISSEEKISGSLLPEEISADFLPKEALDDEKLGTLSDNDDFNKEKLTTVNVTGSRSNNIPRRKKSEAQGLEEGRNESAAQFSIGTLSGKSNVSRCANNKVQLRYGGLQAKGIVLFMAKYIDEVLSGK